MCFESGISRRDVRVLGVWITILVCPSPQGIRLTARLICTVPVFRSKSSHFSPQTSPIRKPDSMPSSRPSFRGVGLDKHRCEADFALLQRAVSLNGSSLAADGQITPSVESALDAQRTYKYDVP